ncbi:hypothetical protein GCM10009564_16620 [Streptomyces thermogriseus]|uniref:Uncharacterized protein n=1 Tax=Streptomyces thermogriseus TaxID=75292 RepID=A0ABP4DHM2_9ACTN
MTTTSTALLLRLRRLGSYGLLAPPLYGKRYGQVPGSGRTPNLPVRDHPEMLIPGGPHDYAGTVTLTPARC